MLMSLFSSLVVDESARALRGANNGAAAPRILRFADGG
jgi:hypothetical protein